jgi:two-component system NtrC family sensor kinase
MSKYPQAKVLFVDDEPNVLTALERAFIDEDYEIYTVNSGEKGLAVMEKHGPFQVIISDYRMPFLNGDEFLKEVYRRWPETERIVLSGYVDIAAIVAAINKGHIYRFIPKPWNDDDLRRTVHDCLERYYLHKKDRAQTAALELSREILASLPAGVVVIDSDNMVIYCNDRAAALLPGAAGKIPFEADAPLLPLATLVRAGGTTVGAVEVGGRKIPVRGGSAGVKGRKVVTLLFLEE